ncbi:MAG: hypothetical protein U1E38_02155 [Rhodospirillales bacterium]
MAARPVRWRARVLAAPGGGTLAVAVAATALGIARPSELKALLRRRS